VQRTCAIIKPDAVERNLAGTIIQLIEWSGMSVVRMEKQTLDRARLEKFYGAHSQKPFFESMIKAMMSGPVVVMELSGQNAIADWRTLMGPTDPAKAAPGTIRRLFGLNIERNSVHGSDAPESALMETKIVFGEE
jgi:nucleoside-diphosphate kinase